jgi:hypothetical protein
MLISKDLDRMNGIYGIMLKKMIKNNLNDPVSSCSSCQKS